MAGRHIDRRELLRLTAGVSVATVMADRGFAQTSGTIDIFGLKLPREFAGVKLPEKPLALLRTISAIIELEKEADRIGLPRSSLMATDDNLPTSTDTSLYQNALPRLVTLIDRSETLDTGIADRAGALLADLNATQRVIPDAFKAQAEVSKAKDFASLKSEYAELFASAEIRAESAKTLAWHANVLRNARTRYEALGNELKVPWFFIGTIHGLEASYNFRAHLHNGDYPLSARTRQVPAGRPLVWMPPDDWASSAKDALKLLGFTGKSDWSLERTLYRLEAYNGFGYRKQGVPSPYLWSFSNHYDRGKYVADGKWSATAKSQQCGAAVLIKALVDGGDVNLG
jgi:lysozyme family protein